MLSCEATPGCGAFDQPSWTIQDTGVGLCCLFQSGNTGDGHLGAVGHFCTVDTSIFTFSNPLYQISMCTMILCFLHPSETDILIKLFVLYYIFLFIFSKNIF